MKNRSRLYILILIAFILAAVAFLIYQYVNYAEEQRKIYENLQRSAVWNAPCDCDKIDRPIGCHACIAKQGRHAGREIDVETCPPCFAMWTWHPALSVNHTGKASGTLSK